MSQLTHPLNSVRSHATVAVAGLLALAATVAVVLVIAIGGSSNDSTSTSAKTGAPAGVRYDGGPDEGAGAASFAPQLRYDGGPEEGSASISGR